ncbi:choice-of-anchor Q domain-containing protein [Marinicella meishanensis]|uniref:choice-of-anchor Q domain-containing protein n=1 Tax=Marinicella meishanensis TaxID=2873263 RepID=UPI001CBCF2CF|nr:choice-of-anchor Q domain-containing protein [Marinicella sp. NBU2979]
MAATFQVTVNDDPFPNGCHVNDCSLREAIIAANDNPGEDTIKLDDVIYHLDRSGSPDEDLAMNGDLDVLDHLRIEGLFTSNSPTGTKTELTTGQLAGTVFEVHEGVSFYLEQVVVKNGLANTALGGVIRANMATVNLNQVALTENTARSGGGVFAVLSDLSIIDSVLDNNESLSDGGAITMVGGSLKMYNTYLIGNQALASGGAVHATFLSHANQPTMLFDRVFILNNFAEYSGGGLFISGTENTPADVWITRSLIQNNEAQFGGGLRQDGSIDTHVMASIFVDNKAAYQAGVNTANAGAVMMTAGLTPYKPSLTMKHSALVANSAEDDAGAVLVSTGKVDLLNVTISGNQANNGGAIVSQFSQVKLSHVTTYDNHAINGVDLRFEDDSQFEVVNSLLEGQCVLDASLTSSLGGNIESPRNTCGIGAGQNDRFNVSPVFLLDPNLADHAGPTPTHAIESTSVALNNGVVINATSTDQRFMPRDSLPDSGAFERQPFEDDLIFKNGLGS